MAIAANRWVTSSCSSRAILFLSVSRGVLRGDAGMTLFSHVSSCLLCHLYLIVTSGRRPHGEGLARFIQDKSLGFDRRIRGPRPDVTTSYYGPRAEGIIILASRVATPSAPTITHAAPVTGTLSIY